MIVAAAIDQLLIAVADAIANTGRLAEVERRAFDRRDARWNRGRVHRRVFVRIDRELVVEDSARTVAGQVEVGMARQVDHRRLVGGRRVVDAEFILVVQGVGHLDVEVAGIALVAVRAQIGELEADAVAARQFLHLPDMLVEALHAAVQRIGAIVGRQRVLLAVERELGIGDAVGVAAGDDAEIRVLAGVVVDIAEAEDDVVDLAVAVRHLDRGDDAAIVDHANRHVLGVGQCVLDDGRSVRQLAEVALFDIARVDGVRSHDDYCTRNGAHLGRKPCSTVPRDPLGDHGFVDLFSHSKSSPEVKHHLRMTVH